MLKSSVSPSRVVTIPVRAETPSMVPVLARRFRAARVPYILRRDRRPASGRVETNASQLSDRAMCSKSPTRAPALVRLLSDKPEPSTVLI